MDRPERRFWLTLGLAFGEPDIAALQRRISSAQFAEWQAFYNLNPFGLERADLRSAQVAAMIYNVNRTKKQKPLSAKDFMFDFMRRRQSVEEQQALLKMHLGRQHHGNNR